MSDGISSHDERAEIESEDIEDEEFFVVMNIKDFENTSMLSTFNNYELIGIEEERPILKLENYVFEGVADEMLGTAILYEESAVMNYKEQCDKLMDDYGGDNDDHGGSGSGSGGGGSGGGDDDNDDNEKINDDEGASQVIGKRKRLKYIGKTDKQLKMTRLFVKKKAP